MTGSISNEKIRDIKALILDQKNVDLMAFYQKDSLGSEISNEDYLIMFLSMITDKDRAFDRGSLIKAALDAMKGCDKETIHEIMIGSDIITRIAGVYIKYQLSVYPELNLILKSEQFKSLDPEMKRDLIRNEVLHYLFDVGAIGAVNELLNDSDIAPKIIGYIPFCPQFHQYSHKVFLGQNFDLNSNPIKHMDQRIAEMTDLEGFPISYHMIRKRLAVDGNILSKMTKEGFSTSSHEKITLGIYGRYEGPVFKCNYFHYSVNNPKGKALIFSNSKNMKIDDLPADHVLLSRGYDVINLDPKYMGKDITHLSIYDLIYNHHRDIDFVIINAGGESKYSMATLEHIIDMEGANVSRSFYDIRSFSDFVKWMTSTYDEKNKIRTVDFLRGINKQRNEKELSVLLTSNSGQLAAKGFVKEMPAGSKILALSEDQHIGESFYSYNASHLGIKSLLHNIMGTAGKISLKDLAALYVFYATPFDRSSPYYGEVTPNGYKGFSCIDTDRLFKEGDMKSKLDKIRESVIEKLCLSHLDKSCQLRISKGFDQSIKDPSILSTNNLLKLRDEIERGAQKGFGEELDVQLSEYAAYIAIACSLHAAEINSGEYTPHSGEF